MSGPYYAAGNVYPKGMGNGGGGGGITCNYAFQFDGGSLSSSPQLPVAGRGQSGTLLIAFSSGTALAINGQNACSITDTSGPFSGVVFNGNIAFQINHTSTLPAPGTNLPVQFMVGTRFGCIDATGTSGFTVDIQRYHNNAPRDEIVISGTVTSGTAPVSKTVAIAPGDDATIALYLIDQGGNTAHIGVTINGVDLGVMQDGGGADYSFDTSAGQLQVVHVQEVETTTTTDISFSNTGIGWEYIFVANEITEPLPGGTNFTDICGNAI